MLEFKEQFYGLDVVEDEGMEFVLTGMGKIGLLYSHNCESAGHGACRGGQSLWVRL